MRAAGAPPNPVRPPLGGTVHFPRPGPGVADDPRDGGQFRAVQSIYGPVIMHQGIEIRHAVSPRVRVGDGHLPQVRGLVANRRKRKGPRIAQGAFAIFPTAGQVYPPGTRVSARSYRTGHRSGAWSGRRAARGVSAQLQSVALLNWTTGCCPGPDPGGGRVAPDCSGWPMVALATAGLIMPVICRRLADSDKVGRPMYGRPFMAAGGAWWLRRVSGNRRVNSADRPSKGPPGPRRSPRRQPPCRADPFPGRWIPAATTYGKHRPSRATTIGRIP